MYFRRFPLYHYTIRENTICVRKQYASSEKSKCDSQDATTCVLFRECHLPLPWACICGAPLLQCLGAWGSMVPHRQCHCSLCRVASALAHLRRYILGTTTYSARVGHRACSDECLLLSGDLPHSIRNGWSYRIPWSHLARSTRRTDSA